MTFGRLEKPKSCEILIGTFGAKFTTNWSKRKKKRFFTLIFLLIRRESFGVIVRTNRTKNIIKKKNNVFKCQGI